MHNFATIKHIQTFEKVSYFSIIFDSDSLSLFEVFSERIKNDVNLKEDLQIITAWLIKIGARGAKKIWFREEGSAQALPPKIHLLAGKYTSLRLYCAVLNESVVVLFSGDIKTTLKAQDCPNVKDHFQLANRISERLTQAIIDKFIVLDDTLPNRMYIEEGYEINM
jgi:hypothetical protein